MPLATTDDGAEVRWESAGEGLPLVLVHGVTETRHLWGPIGNSLAERFRVLSLDLRGHGESGRARDYSYLAMAADVAAVVDAAGVSEPIVIGHSLGGLVATTYAAQHDVRAVVNVDLSLDTRPIAARIRMLEPRLRGPDYRDTLRSMLAALAGDAVSDATRQTIEAHAAQAPQDVVLAVYDILLRTDDDQLLTTAQDLMDNIDAPYLLIHGAELSPDYKEWVTTHLRNVTIEVWPESGHFLHLADPQRFVRRVLDFIDAQVPST
jgi:pimeloyl-ACP methyl ester carboxylesterase